MRLIAHWRAVLARAWSVRLLAAAFVLIALDEGIGYLEPWLPLDSVFWLALVFAIGKPLLVVAAIVARIVGQKNLEGRING